jgi:hypothetical protein
MSWVMALCISDRCMIVVIVVNKLVCTLTKDIVRFRGQSSRFRHKEIERVVPTGTRSYLTLTLYSSQARWLNPSPTSAHPRQLHRHPHVSHPKHQVPPQYPNSHPSENQTYPPLQYRPIPKARIKSIDNHHYISSFSNRLRMGGYWIDR